MLGEVWNIQKKRILNIRVFCLRMAKYNSGCASIQINSIKFVWDRLSTTRFTFAITYLLS